MNKHIIVQQTRKSSFHASKNSSVSVQLEEHPEYCSKDSFETIAVKAVRLTMEPE
jgi:hypothetical protein